MFAHCLFCHGALGANDIVEAFPVGRRLAFDGAQGRLWVVCPRCGQWNLTPLEERWEAIEECERLFRDTRKRVATDEIGLARVGRDVDLIRIGRPLRPEFAAWRYGERLRRRRRLAFVGGGVSLAVIGVCLTTSALPVALMAPAAQLGYSVIARRHELAAARRFLDRTVAHHLGEPVPLPHVLRRLYDVLAGTPDFPAGLLLLPTAEAPGWKLRIEHPRGLLDFAGAEALDAAHRLLPAANISGGSPRAIERAVAELEAVADPAGYFGTAIDRARRGGDLYSGVGAYPAPIRLALEMAAHEETERRAMEGELAALAEAWREAEEIAMIADGLLLPDGVTTRLAALKRGTDAPAGGAPGRGASRDEPSA